MLTRMCTVLVMIGVIAVTVLTVVYADEIVNFTLNKSKPANPMIFPFQKTDQGINEQQQNVSDEEQNKDDRGIFEKIVDVAKSVKKRISKSLNNRVASCRAGEGRGLLPAASCKALATFKMGCTIDSDCADQLAVCDQNARCFKPSGCISLIKNGDPLIKADLVFVGDSYYYDRELKRDVLEMVDWSGDNRGFMSIEPFKSNRTRFNIWMTRGYNLNTSSSGGPDRYESLQSGKECDFVDYTIMVSKRNFISYAYVDGEGDAYLSTVNGSRSHLGRLLLHEFGHAFGLLADEYTRSDGEYRPMYPNCAPDNETAKRWWKDIPNLTYDPGCSYVNSNVRPTYNSIMRYQWLAEEYGEVNKRALEEILNKYE